MDGPLYFPRIDGLDILLALITHIHPATLFFIAKKIVQRLLVPILAEWTVCSGCPPFMATEAAKKTSFPFLQK
jgi:hypothetical protein